MKQLVTKCVDKCAPKLPGRNKRTYVGCALLAIVVLGNRTWGWWDLETAVILGALVTIATGVSLGIGRKNGGS